MEARLQGFDAGETPLDDGDVAADWCGTPDPEVGWTRPAGSVHGDATPARAVN